MGNADEMTTVGIGYYYDDLPAGERYRTVGRTITEADITLFIGAAGMVEVLFTNLEHLRHESVFDGKRLVPAAQVLSFAEGLLMQTAIQGTGIALLSLEIEIKGPTFAGDTIHVECEILEARGTSKPDRGIVKTLNRVVKQNGETVMTYKPVRMIKGRP